MFQTANSNEPRITADWLTSRTFTFRADSRGPAISENFTFHPNGFVVGHDNRNEAFWEIGDQSLDILDLNGRMTCRMSLELSGDDSPRLSGNFISPADGYIETPVRHILEENDGDFHARIQSFDLFDTLVARRCYDPLEVFRRVERKSRIANFAARRHLVEMSIFGRQPYGIGDIYSLLIAEGLFSPQQAEVVLLMELEEEWDTLIPISAMVARVNPDDIIISDMYLPQSFIERVLREKCGLHNKLYLSNYGKHHRTIWPSIIEQHRIRGHFGDNLHADVMSPAAFGLSAGLITISKWNGPEEILRSAGLADYAHAVREARLTTFNPNPAIQNALKAQIMVTIPLMLLGSFWIRKCAENYGADKILAASRDCNLWHQMLSSPHFARMGMPRTEYIQISRTLCYADSDAYEAYLKSRLGTRNLLVDFVGTGRSLHALVKRQSLQDVVRPCILVSDPDNFSEGQDTFETLIRKDFLNYRVFLEALNSSLDGSAVSAVFQDGVVDILTQPNEFNDRARAAISELQKSFARFLPRLDQFDAPKSLPALEVLMPAADAIMEFLPAEAAKLDLLHGEQLRNLQRGTAENATVAERRSA